MITQMSLSTGPLTYDRGQKNPPSAGLAGPNFAYLALDIDTQHLLWSPSVLQYFIVL